MTKLARLNALVAPLEGIETEQHPLRFLAPAANLPPALLEPLRANRRLMGVVRLLEQGKRERAVVEAVPAWHNADFAQDLMTSLDANIQTLGKVASQLARNRLVEEWKYARTVNDMGAIERFEIKKSRWEIGQALRKPLTADLDAAIGALKTIIPKIEDGSSIKAELLFQLAELYREKADTLLSAPRTSHRTTRRKGR